MPQGNKNTKVYAAFLFMGHAFWKENFQDSIILLELIVLNCCVKVHVRMADLCKIGLKMREGRFRELSS